jgi:hypothetical protein
MVLDSVTAGTAQHPSPHDFFITNRAADHPIMKGLPSVWLHANDELYSNPRGPAKIADFAGFSTLLIRLALWSQVLLRFRCCLVVDGLELD